MSLTNTEETGVAQPEATHSAIHEEARFCLQCGEKIAAGSRIDKLFCDSGCRGLYNNNKSRQERLAKEAEAAPAEQPPQQPELSIPEYIHRIEGIMRRNREILAAICTEKQKDVSSFNKTDLIGRGFNTKYFTSQPDPTLENGHVYRFCFEYGYMEIENNYVVIVKREREVTF